MITVKCEYLSDFRRFTIDGDSSFKDLYAKVANLFKIGDFVIKYKDQEGDWITISTDMELKESIKSNSGPLKLSVMVADPNAEKKSSVDPDQLQNALLKLVDTNEFKDRLIGLFKELIASDSLRQVLSSEPVQSTEPSVICNLPTSQDDNKAKEILGDDAVVITESVNLQPIEPIVAFETSQEKPKEEPTVVVEPAVATLHVSAEVPGPEIVPQHSTACAPSVVTTTAAISTSQLPEPAKPESHEIPEQPQDVKEPEPQAPEKPKQEASSFMKATEAIGTPIFNFLDSFMSPKPTHDPKWNPALEQLSEMGFTDIKKNVDLLEKHGGRVEQVLDILLAQV